MGLSCGFLLRLEADRAVPVGNVKLLAARNGEVLGAMVLLSTEGWIMSLSGACGWRSATLCVDLQP